MAGGIFTGANPGYVTRELAYQLKDSGADMMIAAAGSFNIALEAATQAGLNSERVFLFDSTMPDSSSLEKQAQKGTRHWTELVGSRKKGEDFEWFEPKNSKTTTCTLNYSSGTVWQSRSSQSSISN